MGDNTDWEGKFEYVFQTLQILKMITTGSSYVARVF